MVARAERTRGRRLPTAIVIASVVLVALVWTQQAAASSSDSFPKIANIYFPTLIGADLEDLARYDMLVLASRAEEWYQDEIAVIRDLNPDIVLLIHMPVGYHGDYTAPQIEADVRARLYGYDWWMENTDGEKVVNAHGDGMMNVTTNCPRNYNGERLCDWLPKHIASWVGPGGCWDGVFLDYAMNDIAWLNRYIDKPMDSDRNGIADASDDLDRAWHDGMEIVVSKLRDLVGDDFIIATNGNNTFYEYANGSTREDFPLMHGDWYDNIEDSRFGYVTNEREYSNPSANIINTIWRGQVANGDLVRTADFERQLRFTLASTLVFGNGYFSFDGGAGLHDHSQTWWHELYDMDLGRPTGKAMKASMASELAPYIEWGDMTRVRRFEKGLVVVNPTVASFAVELQSPYYPAGSWNGSFYPFSEIVDSASLSPRSGGFFAGSGKVLAGVAEVSYFVKDNGSVQLTWNDVAGATGYSVYRTPERGDATETELVAVVDGASFIDASGAARAGDFRYSVAPIDECKCEGRPSRPITVSTEPGSGLSITVAVSNLDGGPAFEMTIPDSLLFDLVRYDEDGERETIEYGATPVFGVYRAVDESAEPGRTYIYEAVCDVTGVDTTLAREVVSVPGAPALRNALHGCAPNPVADGTRISFDIGEDDRWGGADVDLTVYDVSGRIVRRLTSGRMEPGSHEVFWDGRDDRGGRVAAGNYFYALRIEEETLTGKMLVIR